ncbi:MAG: NACHT domain-containing protein [Blastocatellia bacterium]
MLNSSFREEIAGLYGSLDFEVYRQYPLGEWLIEIFVRKQDAGILREAVVECLEQAPNEQELAEILDRHRHIAALYPSFSRKLIAARNLPDEVRNALISAGTIPNTYAELIRELAPLDEYAQKLIAENARWRDERWRGENWYIPPEARLDEEAQSHPADAVVKQWLNQPQSRMLVLLGDPGTGKSTFVRALACEAAKKFLDDSLLNPAPLLIPLGEVRLAESWEGLLAKHFDQRGLPAPPLSHLDYLARQGRILLFLDAFDEMADRVRPEVIRNNIRELMRPIQRGWKTLFTCRPQYFKDQEELVCLLHSVSALTENLPAMESETSDLPRIEIVHLQEFNDQRINAYRAKVRPDLTADAWNTIKSIHGLEEMTGRPLLLEMILQSVPAIERAGIVNPAEIYMAFTNQWIEREAQRSRLLDRETKHYLMKELAWRLWQDERESLRDGEIADFVRELKQENRLSFGDEAVGEIARHLEAGSFLTRDAAGNFSFTHKSFDRYFLARRLCELIANLDDPIAVKMALDTHPIDRGTLLFLAFLLDEEEKVRSLKLILNSGCQPRVSENALTILYWRARFRCGVAERISNLDVLLEETARAIPPGAHLAGADLRGAQLPAIDLTGADFRGADLRGADFTHAQLAQADFRNAALHGATFNHANLAQCNFTGATGSAPADFTGADLTGATGLSIV